MNFWSSLRLFRRRTLPDVFANSEEGFVDASFAVVRHRVLPDGVRTVQVRGRSRDLPVGLLLDLLPDWRPDTLGDGIPVHWGRVRYRSVGPESDAWVRVLSAAYALPPDGLIMQPHVEFAAIALSGDPCRPQRGPLNMKLFFESEDEDRYAEIYTNLLLSEQLMEVREKDPEYRAPLIRALTEARA